jgi:hypothetical protein
MRNRKNIPVQETLISPHCVRASSTVKLKPETREIPSKKAKHDKSMPESVSEPREG